MSQNSHSARIVKVGEDNIWRWGQLQFDETGEIIFETRLVWACFGTSVNTASDNQLS